MASDPKGLSPLEAMRAAMALDLPAHLSHTVLVLATHWPNIWPGQRLLAAEMHVSRRTVNDRLLALEDMGVVYRIRRGGATTLYGLRFKGVRSTAKHVRSTAPEEQLNDSQKEESVIGWVDGDDMSEWS